MTERTVTEQQVLNAMNKRVPQKDMIIINEIFDELFPELPKVGELVLTWDKGSDSTGGWFPFVKINDDGRVVVLDYDGDDELWDSYRRQTLAERGEG
jgi:hypothetical protein